MFCTCWDCENGRHDDCVGSFFCKCECQSGGFFDALQKACTIVGGATLAAGGVAVTIGSFGLAAPIGGAMTGAGISATIHGVQKTISEERLTFGGLACDIGVGLATGALTGGVCAAGESVATYAAKEGLKQGIKAGATKLVVRSAAGAVTGMAAHVVDEAKQSLTTDQEFNVSFTGLMTSAAVGAVGGAGSHVTSNVTKLSAVSSGAAKSVTRVVASCTTAGTADAMAQGLAIAAGDQKEYNFGRTMKSAACSSVTTAATEGVKNGIYLSKGGKAQMYHDSANNKAIKKVPREDRTAVKREFQNLQNIPEPTLNAELEKAEKVTLKHKVQELRRPMAEREDQAITKIQNRIDELRALNQNDPNVQQQLRQAGKELNGMVKAKKDAISFQHATESRLPDRGDIAPMNSANAHMLIDERLDQIAVDINPPSAVDRGKKRAFIDYNHHAPIKQRFAIAGYTGSHDYSTGREGSIPNHGQSSFYELCEFWGNRAQMASNRIHIQGILESICKEIKDIKEIEEERKRKRIESIFDSILKEIKEIEEE